MSTNASVAVVRTTPETVHDDTARLCELAGMGSALDKGATTILKDNISWHMPYLSANTTPWQLEGTIDALKGAGYDDLVTVHNNTVVTDPVKGGRLNKLTPVYEKHEIRELFNFKPEDMGWKVTSRRRRCSLSTRSSQTASRCPTTSRARTSSTCRP